MSIRSRLANETGCSEEGVSNTVGRRWILGQTVLAVAATATGNYETALTASTTSYFAVAYLPKACRIKTVYFRSYAIGVAGATLDLLSVASAIHPHDGTATITQLVGTDLTAKTAVKATVLTAGTNVAAGSILVIKLVTGAAETMGNLLYAIELIE